MRPLLLILATLALIGGGFALYVWLQPRVVAPDQDSRIGAATRPSRPEGSGTVIGAGTSGWVKRWNTETGELASQFRAARYDPQRDGTILVDKPQAEFLLDEGRLLRVEGKSGSVIMPQAPPSETDDLLSGSTPVQAPPSRGTLKDVRLTLFESMADADGNDPYLTVTMNNVAFDNDTFRITTESFVNAAGQEVPGEQVPVVVRGKDYDFDGRGLTIRWNDLSQRLELLEIAHGEKLVVKNPELMGQLSGTSNQQGVAGASTRPSSPTPPATSPKKRSRKKRKPATAAATTKPDAKETLYQATFERDVQITQDDVQLVLADTLRAQFLLGESDESDEEQENAPPTTQLVSDNGQPLATQDSESAGLDLPATAPSTAPASTTPTTAASTAPTTAEADLNAPIIVRWQGRLTVVPIQPSESAPLEVGQGLVHLTGSPLSLEWQGSTITCGSATYTTGGEVAQFDATDDVPVVTLTDKRGSVVTTRQMTYSNVDGTARLTGVSLARIPTSEDASAELMQLAWDRTCTLTFVEDAAGDRVIERADIDGNVAVEHPRMKLTSDALQLAFAPAPADSSSIELDRLIATGSVHCDVNDEVQGDRSFSADRLELETAKDQAGSIYPRKITADGNVVATDDASQLTARHVVAILRPSSSADPQGEGQGGGASDEIEEVTLESLTARDRVKVTTRDGAEVTADQLLVGIENGNTVVQLLGTDEAPATLNNGENTLRGQHIVTILEAQKADVLGPGSIHGVATRQGSDTEPQPFDLSWTGGGTLDAGANRITFRENIALTMTHRDGPATTASADRAEITLADRPDSSTQPATAALADAPGNASTTPPSTRASTQPSAQDSIFAGGTAFGALLEKKEPIAFSLAGNVKVESAEKSPDGSIVRGVLIKGDTLNYDLLERKAVIPGPGQMLVRDHRPIDAAEESASANEFQDRGATAFEWRELLSYSDGDQLATMQGDVVVHHVPDPGTRGREFWMWTQRISAELEPQAANEANTATATSAPATSPSQAAATSPATQPAADALKAIALKRLTAEGGVRVEADHRAGPDAPAEKLQLTAQTIAYDARTGVLTARGMEERPVRISGSSTVREGSVQELRWNTRTDQIEVTRGRVR